MNKMNRSLKTKSNILKYKIITVLIMNNSFQMKYQKMMITIKNQMQEIFNKWHLWYSLAQEDFTQIKQQIFRKQSLKITNIEDLQYILILLRFLEQVKSTLTIKKIRTEIYF